ncbi:MAG: sigma-54-dependent Fis family transcriptional regulator [Verrucomicrobia bacterium]|nr:sigma-54-dependent Fis family transcriptional regulator [Verrucomicrobiota bacterium]
MKNTVLILEDKPSDRDLLCEDLPEHGFEVVGCDTCEKARTIIREKPVDAILADYCLPDGTGADFFRSIHEEFASVPVIFITNFPNIEQAVGLMKGGATDYILKPFSVRDVANRLRRAIEASTLRAEVGYHRRRALPLPGKHELIGGSPPMQAVRQAIAEVIRSPSTPVLITGETGTGKEVVARLVHQGTCGDSQPFVEVDCAAIPKESFEKELFGHEPGAAAGADRDKEGLLELASAGTIFFDEIAEVDLRLQGRLLSVLETRESRRLGGTRPFVFGARIIAATNRDIQQLLDTSQFRLDLYHRLAVYEIPIPPLSERREDIRELSEYFLRDAAVRHGKSVQRLSERFYRKAELHSFPGNVRELRNWVEQAVIQSEGTEADFISRSSSRIRVLSPAPESAAPSPVHVTLSEHERALVETALRQSQGNKSAAARQLGISRGAFLRRLTKFGAGS